MQNATMENVSSDFGHKLLRKWVINETQNTKVSFLLFQSSWTTKPAVFAIHMNSYLKAKYATIWLSKFDKYFKLGIYWNGN